MEFLVLIFKDERGQWKYLGEATKISLHHLVGKNQMGNRLFTKAEIINDLMNGNLDLENYDEDTSLEQRKKDVHRESFFSLRIWRDELERYLEFKNKQNEQNNIYRILDAIDKQDQKFQILSDLIRNNFREITEIKFEVNKIRNNGNFIGINVIAKDLGIVPGTIRNTLNRNKEIFGKFIISNIDILSFHLSFVKIGNCWRTSEIIWEHEKKKLLNYDIQQQLAKLKRHGKRAEN